MLSLLEDECDLENEPTFEMITTRDLNAGAVDDRTQHVTLFLYRVDTHPTKRYIEIPGDDFGDPPRRVLALELRFLLTVWGDSFDWEHKALQRCIEILDRNAILAGDRLDDTYADWEPGTSLRVVMESLSTEDMMRIWDSLDTSYRISVPYLVQTTRTSSQRAPGGEPVRSRTLVSGEKRG